MKISLIFLKKINFLLKLFNFCVKFLLSSNRSFIEDKCKHEHNCNDTNEIAMNYDTSDDNTTSNGKGTFNHE